MSSGANIGDGKSTGIGDDPVDMGTFEKLQLGWLNYETAQAGQRSEHKLGPSTANTKQAQALLTVLPDKSVPLELGAPCVSCGSRYYWSSQGNDLNTTMTKPVTAAGSLRAKVRYEAEEDWDYAFLEASPDAGATWSPVATNLSDTANDQSGFNASRTGLTGSVTTWTDLSAVLPAGTNAVRFRYQTDGAVAESGFRVDDITVGGTPIGTAETDDGWAFDGFRTTTGSEDRRFANYYLSENRQYVSYDESLRTAYNFGFLDKTPDLVESYPYQNGLLVNYWDTSQSDNNVGDHPGKGLILPVDANPDFYHSFDGQLLRPRVLSFDSTFGLERTDAITVNKNSRPTTIPSRAAVPVFDDTRSWWSNTDVHAATGSHVGRYQPGWNGVEVPKTGTLIRVKSVSATGFMQVQVSPK